MEALTPLPRQIGCDHRREGSLKNNVREGIVGKKMIAREER